MPFCDIDEGVSLHYLTNTLRGDATDLDCKKQTIILLPPLLGGAEFWLREQLKDKRLSKRYNLVAFDQRNMGLTKSPLSPERDAWVDAADLALAHEILQLPPCHVFAVALNSCGAAMKFATLWPSKCLSLCLCHPPAQAGEDPEWLVQGYLETTQAYCFPKDLENFEQACMEFAWFWFSGLKISADLEDEVEKCLNWYRPLTDATNQVVAWWQMNLPPSKRTHFLAQCLCGLQRSRMSDLELRSIKQPTLFIQGEKSFMSPPEKTQELCDKMPHGRVFTIRGGPQLLTFIPEYASVANRVYVQFLSTFSKNIPISPSHHVQPDPKGVCQSGLKRLAALMGDPSIANRDASTPLSFSCLSPDLVAQNALKFIEYAKGESEAVSVLDEHGQPLRKFSERHLDEWKPAAFHTLMERSHSGHYVTVQTSLTYSHHHHEEAQCL